MEDKIVRYTLRVDRLLFKKFRYIAESEGRSANKEIEQYLKKRVAEFEKENGKIETTLTRLINFHLWSPKSVSFLGKRRKERSVYYEFQRNSFKHGISFDVS